MTTVSITTTSFAPFVCDNNQTHPCPLPQRDRVVEAEEVEEAEVAEEEVEGVVAIEEGTATPTHIFVMRYR